MHRPSSGKIILIIVATPSRADSGGRLRVDGYEASINMAQRRRQSFAAASGGVSQAEKSRVGPERTLSPRDRTGREAGTSDRSMADAVSPTRGIATYKYRRVCELCDTGSDPITDGSLLLSQPRPGNEQAWRR